MPAPLAFPVPDHPGIARILDCRCDREAGWWDVARVVLTEQDDARCRAAVDAYWKEADHRYGKESDTYRVRLLGFRGELGVSIATGLTWGEGDASKPDLWGDGWDAVEVRSTGARVPMLSFYPDDQDRGKRDWPFILAQVHYPVVTILGFAWRDELVAHAIKVPGRMGLQMPVERLHRLRLHRRR